ncbi:hypothetical protein RHSIM_Rhsim12G0104000 [Rhododendron simsii]|uniref:Uncharacterized protein n=1 Tax=Rhododendron simsii TaxID=118357 RepID=A0A834L9E1_RHOSS|nr:hypothetical protein RHSIM_Rhsim12G0104000 [Rhododendron simsii]
MNPLKPFVSDTAFYKAYDKLLEGVHYREGFIKLTPDGRKATVSKSPCHQSGIPPYQLEDDFSDDDDLLELETLAMMERACNEQVNRFPSDVHKKYTSWDEAYNAWVTFTRQVEDTAPPSLLLLVVDPSGSSTDYSHPARDWESKPYALKSGSKGQKGWSKQELTELILRNDERIARLKTENSRTRCGIGYLRALRTLGEEGREVELE